MNLDDISPALFMWTDLTLECYQLQGDCSKCNFAKVQQNLATFKAPCHIARMLPKIIELHGIKDSKRPKKKESITMTKYQRQVYASILKNPGITSGELAEMFGKTPESLRTLLNVMHARGYLSKVTVKELVCREWGMAGKRVNQWHANVITEQGSGVA